MNIQNIDEVMNRISELLQLGGLDDWAEALESMRRQYAIDPVGGSAKIMSVYGGMGSLNDLVLYREGQPLVKENNELDLLRSKLFLLCQDAGRDCQPSCVVKK